MSPNATTVRPCYESHPLPGGLRWERCPMPAIAVLAIPGLAELGGCGVHAEPWYERAHRYELPPEATLTDVEYPALAVVTPGGRSATDTHRLCRRCQLMQTAAVDQVCDLCADRLAVR